MLKTFELDYKYKSNYYNLKFLIKNSNLFYNIYQYTICERRFFVRKSIKNYLIVFGFVSAVAVILMFSSKLALYDSFNNKDAGNIKVSVIVPVYNTEKYIDECLDSIENQTLKEIEIICINDGSTDNSLQVLKAHQQKDSRIKIIDQKNAGVCAARNQGIKNAKGTYIAFVDSDDLIPPYVYEKAYYDAVKYNVNVVAFKIMTFIDGEHLDLNQFKYDRSKIKRCGRRSYQNPFTHMLENSCFVVTKVFKRSFVIDNNLLFKEGVTHYEDGLFNFLAFPLIKEMVQDDNISYCYRTSRPNSAVTKRNFKKVLTSSLKVDKELINHHDLFNFRKADEWILGKIMDITYTHITKDVEDPEDKKYFAKKLLELLEEDYFKKFDFKIPKWALEQIDTLRAIARW